MAVYSASAMIPPQNVSESVYRWEVAKRRERCQDLINRYAAHSPDDYAVVILSCKRPRATARLLRSLVGLDAFMDGLNCEWYFVDNGSGPELPALAEKSKLFTHIIAHETNLGMGRAINHVLALVRAEWIIFVEDDLVFDADRSFIRACRDIFEDFPEVGIIKLKRKADWDTMYPYRRVGPMQTTTTGVRFHPWLPSPRWSFRWGQRPWYPVGIHNVWSLGPVMFRWCAWKEAGPIPSGQGRGQAVAAEEEYARRFNLRWIAAKPVDFAPFSQPTTSESPGFVDEIA